MLHGVRIDYCQSSRCARIDTLIEWPTTSPRARYGNGFVTMKARLTARAASPATFNSRELSWE